MQRIENCRCCDSTELYEVLDLGITPLANSLLTKEQLEEPEFTAPLSLVFCRNCALVQITCAVHPEQVFRSYVYFSSLSDTMLKHAKDLVQRLVVERRLTATSVVVEIGSNDGYLLKNYIDCGIQPLGIEPALNVAEVARQKGINTLGEFFDEKLALQLVDQIGNADVIHAHNVLAHVPKVNGILEGIQILLKDEGLAVIEVPYALEMVDKIEFDTIYHEHVFYFSVLALSNLCKRNALVLRDIERLKIHGGSLRLYIGKTGQPSDTVKEIIGNERARRFDTEYGYRDFAATVESLRNQLVTLLRDLKKRGLSIAAYGAAAKGATLLNYFGIGSDILDFVVDRNPAKQGLYMPGVKLPIYPPSELLVREPDYVLLLTWNFADEIIEQQSEYVRQGGRFIVPIPTPKIVALDPTQRIDVASVQVVGMMPSAQATKP
jgi:hypothetical protein